MTAADGESNGANGHTTIATTNTQHKSQLYPDKPTSEPTILYFGFGSNLLPSILTNKKVNVLYSQPAFIPCIKLKFNLSTKSIVEPSYANLSHLTADEYTRERAKFDKVMQDTHGDTQALAKIIRTAGKDDLCIGCHGVIHELSQTDMSRMDLLEGNGQAYKREQFDAVTYNGLTVKVFAYICHDVSSNPNPTKPDDPKPAKLNDMITLKDTPPSHRYLRVLVNGAKHFRLNKTYVDWLENHKYTPLPDSRISSEHQRQIDAREISTEELQHHGWRDAYDSVPADQQPDFDPPIWISLKGIVFDISQLQFPRAYKRMLSGNDGTFFAAGRCAIEPVDDNQEHYEGDNDSKAYQQINGDINNSISVDVNQPEAGQKPSQAAEQNLKEADKALKRDPHKIPTTIDELQDVHKQYINAVVVDYIHQGATIAGHMHDYKTYDF